MRTRNHVMILATVFCGAPAIAADVVAITSGGLVSAGGTIVSMGQPIVGSMSACPVPLRLSAGIVPCIVCPPDWDGNGAIQPADVAGFVNTWFTSLQGGTLAGDFDGNCAVQPADVAAFVNAWFGALGGAC